MKTDKLENLFRKKLENYNQEVSENAREAVFSFIKQKKRKRIIARFSVAASVLMLVALGSLFLLNRSVENLPGLNNEISASNNDLNNGESVGATKDEKIIQPKETEVPVENNVGTLNNLAIQEEWETESEEKIKSSPGINANIELLEPVLAAESSTSLPAIDTLIFKPQILIAEEVGLTVDNESEAEPAIERKKVTIEYIAAGSSQEEKGVKKLYKKIENMKTADEMLADVRNFKDQLFALEFIKKEKKDKTSNE